MRNIKITLEYDGTHFHGWQIQSPNQRTVQGEIQSALKRIYQQPVKVTGSGRTDSGVHALGQVANFHIRTAHTTAELLRALNALLPKDISVLDVAEVPGDFHAQYAACYKTYRYSILHRVIRSPLRQHNTLFYPYDLNVTAMRRAAKHFIGRQDFRSFMAADPEPGQSPEAKNTVRTIYELGIHRSQSILSITVTANGFLYKMVRNIVGTLLAVGADRIKDPLIPVMIAAKDRSLLPETAPAHALCLISVAYDPLHIEHSDAA